MQLSSVDLWPGRAIAALGKFFLALAALGVIYMTLSTVYDVFVRYALNAPTSWATETSTYVLIATIFFGAAHTHLTDGHVRVHVLLNHLQSAGKRDLELICAWIGLLYVGIAGWQAVLMVLSDYEHGSRIFSLLLTPSWLPKTPIAIGLCLLAGALAVEIDRLSRNRSYLRRLVPYAIVFVVAAFLALLGRTPTAVPGMHFDLGSTTILVAVIAGAFAANGPRVGAYVAAILAASIALFVGGRTLGAGFLTTLLFIAIVFYLAIGVRIAFALAMVGMLSVYFLTPTPFPLTLPDRTWSGVNSFSLTAVPLYVLMGAFLVRSGLSNELFSVMAKVLARLPGGLAHAATAGCAVFAAVSGSSVATAATIGTVACPEMTRRGYSEKLTYGTVAAGGTLGILIPPSVPMIIYATAVGVPVVKLFIAGILPGILMTLLFMAVILGWVLLYPGAAPALPKDANVRLTRDSAIDSVLVLVLIALIIGCLYAGIATATETGALGALFAFLICALRGRLKPETFSGSLNETVAVTSFIFLIVVGANIITFGFDYLKISQKIMAAATEMDVNRWVVMASVVLLYVVLGAFLDSISMLVLTLPVIFPVIVGLGFDALWFGVVLVIMAEIGLIHPPMGMNLYVLQGIGKTVAMRTIALGALPFIGAMFITIFLLCLFPEIALFLTRHLE